MDAAGAESSRELVAELCRLFYDQGWVSGTGGSISIKVNEDLYAMAPSGVQKERMKAEDIYVLKGDGTIIAQPVTRPWPHKPPKVSECAPLFMAAYNMRNAGAVIHSHSIWSALATLLEPGATEFRISHMEMIKGIAHHAYGDTLVVPIIENTPRECELTDSLTKAVQDYPKTTAVLVRNHGVYVWGDSWISAKTQAECYHYLFQAAVELHRMGRSLVGPDHANSAHQELSNGHPAKRPHVTEPISVSGVRAVVLDIEGTTTPISFVHETLFPYARDYVEEHLRATWDSPATQDDVALLRAQCAEDIAAGRPDAAVIPLEPREVAINVCAHAVKAMIAADRKVTGLKQLQGHIWRRGYECKALSGYVYSDVPQAMKRWTQHGIKVYIYSSGSREAQRLIFGHTSCGDLTGFLSGYFDTTVGTKVASTSYVEIAETLGFDNRSQILFATDVAAEAQAATAAGFSVAVLSRPGNKELPPNHGFRVVTSLLDI
eukprot:jgi/Chlat1/3683/Chrsp24S00803